MNRDLSTTFIKGLEVFKAFDASTPRLTLAEISRKTGIDRAAVRRLVLTLVHLGYVARHDRHYALTPRVLVLAGSFLQSNHIGARIQPILTRHSVQLGAAISMAMLDGQDAVYVAQATLETSHISFGFTIGSRLPVAQTALGRMLVAGLADAPRAALLADLPLTAHTPHSLTDRAALARAIAADRAAGSSLVAGAFEPGVSGIAVPVAGMGEPPAALGASAPVAALDSPVTQRLYLSALQACAAEIAHALAAAP